MTRSISHSEASTLLDCQAKHDFAYVGQLAGTALGPLTTHARLREGKAWGMAMAAFHDRVDPTISDKLANAHSEISYSLSEDLKQMPFGLDAEGQIEFAEMGLKLHDLLTHYAATCEPIGVDRQELKLDVAIPSRHSKRASTRYRYTGHVDGIHTTNDGDWIVEFKLRGQLTSLEQVTLSRQIRWYAWAWREMTGRSVVGVIVDERLNEAPKLARWVNAKRKGEGIDGKVPSHAKDQITTPALYLAACQEAGVEASVETIDALAARRWQARHEVFLTEREIDEAGRQLTSMANLVGQFDNGHLYPVRHPSTFQCGGCAFRDICAHPEDTELVNALFTRKPAKKDRQEIAA